MARISWLRRKFFNIALALTLVSAVGVSLWFASPVKALDINISNPSPLTTGSSISFTVTVSIEDTELLPIGSIHLYIYKSDDRATYEATCTNLPLVTGTKSYTSAQTGGGAVNVNSTAAVSWGYGYGYGYVTWQGYGYYFFPPGGYGYGYGYSSGAGTTSVTYNITWSSPTNWPAGDYKAEVKIAANGEQFIRTKSFALTAPTGGGGFLRPQPQPGVTNISGVVNPNGIFVDDVVAGSDDGLFNLDIPRGTKGLTKDGRPLNSISMTTMPEEDRPAPPAGAHVIGLTYNFGPPGATFTTPITLTFIYDESLLPEGVDENDLVIVYWDAVAGEWVALDAITVDSDNNTVSGLVSHFTAFTVLGYEKALPPTPTIFNLGQLSISPDEVKIGEEVTVTITLTNTGGQSGSYEVILKIDNVVVDIEKVTLSAGAGKQVAFTTFRDSAGTYTVDVNGKTGEFTVKPAPVSPPAPPTPALPPAVPPAKPINWWFVGTIIAGAVIVGGVIALVAYRKRQ